jgi:hypothetical protein
MYVAPPLTASSKICRLYGHERFRVTTGHDRFRYFDHDCHSKKCYKKSFSVFATKVTVEFVSTEDFIQFFRYANCHQTFEASPQRDSVCRPAIAGLLARCIWATGRQPGCKNADECQRHDHQN